MRSNSPAGPLGQLTSHLRMVSAPSPGARPHSLAMSATERLLPMASPRSLRSCFSSGPVTVVLSPVEAATGLVWTNLAEVTARNPAATEFLPITVPAPADFFSFRTRLRGGATNLGGGPHDPAPRPVAGTTTRLGLDKRCMRLLRTLVTPP